MKILIALAALVALSGCTVSSGTRLYPEHRHHHYQYQPVVFYNEYHRPICHYRSTLHGVIRVCR